MRNITYTPKAIIVSALIASMTACGGGGGSSSASDDGSESAIAIITTDPDNNATDIERDKLVSATFDADLLTMSIDNNSFQLLRSGAPVAGEVRFDGSDIVSFSAAEELSLLTSYTARATTGIADLSGNSLADDVDWSFTTRDGVWGDRNFLMVGAETPTVIFDKVGNGFVFFNTALAAGDTSLMVRQYSRVDNSWTLGEIIADTDVDSRAHAAFLEDGSPIVIWRHTSVFGGNIFAQYSRLINGVWSAPSQVVSIFPGGTVIKHLQIASNNAGDVIAVWDQESPDLVGVNVYASHYNANNDTWDASPELLDATIETAERPRVAIDSTGNATVIWLQDGEDVVSSRYSVQSDTWSEPELIGDFSASRAPQLTIDANDNVLAVWSAQTSAPIALPFQIWTNRLPNNQTGWQDQTLISGSINGHRPQIETQPDGGAIVVWQHDGTDDDRRDVLVSHFSPETQAWSDAEVLDDEINEAIRPQLVIDDSGNAMAIWNQVGAGTFTDLDSNVFINPPFVWVSRYDAFLSSWSTPRTISQPSASTSLPQLAVDGKGNVTAVWEQSIDGFDTIPVRRFD